MQGKEYEGKGGKGKKARVKEAKERMRDKEGKGRNAK
jgi:hypothetical protein